MKVEDLFTKTLHGQPSELELKMGDVATGEHLLVVGSESKGVSRARIVWATKRNSLKPAVEGDIDSAIVYNDIRESIAEMAYYREHLLKY